MRHQKLFNLLASLSRKELKKFDKFLQSPYFTESEGTRVFFDCIKEHYPTFDESKMELEANYERLFSERLEVKQDTVGIEETAGKRRKMLDDKLNHLLSGIYHLLETFLAMEEAMFVPTMQKKVKDGEPEFIQLQARQSCITAKEELLMRALARRSNFEDFSKYSSPLISRLNDTPAKNSDDYWMLYQIHQWLYFHPGADKLGQKKPGFVSAAKHLDCCFVLTKLRQFAEWNAYSKIKSIDAHFSLLDEIIEEARNILNDAKSEAGPDQHLLIKIYLELILLYQSNEEEVRFKKAGNLFVQYAERMPYQEIRYLLTHFTNIGVRLYSLKGLSIEKDLLSLFQWALSKGLYTANKRMSVASYLNISQIAVECNILDWASHFINAYKAYLDKSTATDAFNAASSHLYFAQGDFDMAHELLISISTRKKPYDFIFKALMLKIYFEKYLGNMEQHEIILNHAATFEKYVSVQKNPVERQKAWTNFIRFTKHLTNLRLRHGKMPEKLKNDLLAELENMQYVNSKKWLSNVHKIRCTFQALMR